MIFNSKLEISKNLSKLIFILFILFNCILIPQLHANSFQIKEIEISEDFNLNFNKKKVFDKAFESAFLQLISKVLVSEDINKIEKTKLSTIKSLIDSFIVSDEKFFENKYYAKFNVNFNKKNTYVYLESKNIFPSIPKKINILFIPILIDSEKNKLVYFGENLIYKKWNDQIKKYHLINYILPTEDIENSEIFNSDIDLIEEYDFKKVVNKYDLKNYIIAIIYQNNKSINILSKLHLNENYKIVNNNYNDLNLKNEESVLRFVMHLKKKYEDEWKKLNLINTSIQVPITISLSSKEHDKIKFFEKTLEELDLVSNFIILSFNKKNIFYKIIYNGAPSKFFSEINESGLDIKKKGQIWRIK
tara:strand:- start:1239 stop:2318 length:1080 start_codon:yes stop_codon:yes gene_type:complete